MHSLLEIYLTYAADLMCALQPWGALMLHTGLEPTISWVRVFRTNSHDTPLYLPVVRQKKVSLDHYMYCKMNFNRRNPWDGDFFIVERIKHCQSNILLPKHNNVAHPKWTGKRQIDEGGIQDAERHDQLRDCKPEGPPATALIHQTKALAAAAHGTRPCLRQEGQLLRARCEGFDLRSQCLSNTISTAFK